MYRSVIFSLRLDPWVLTGLLQSINKAKRESRWRFREQASVVECVA
jgi:hypothetical protein